MIEGLNTERMEQNIYHIHVWDTENPEKLNKYISTYTYIYIYIYIYIYTSLKDHF